MTVTTQDRTLNFLRRMGKDLQELPDPVILYFVDGPHQGTSWVMDWPKADGDPQRKCSVGDTFLFRRQYNNLDRDRFIVEDSDWRTLTVRFVEAVPEAL